MKIRCLIVDDEPIARQIVEKYCSYVPELEVVGSCGDALETKQVLQKEKIDLLFLDINMPVLDGVSFVKSLRYAPLVIFTTAYKDFAHDAFDLAAVDYLLKPFALERFIVAVDKVRHALKPDPVRQESETASFFLIKSDGKIHKLLLNDFQYAEAKGNHVKIVMRDFELRPTITLTAFTELVTGSNIVRVHRSFIINKDKIRLIEGNRVFIGMLEIPIGANYRAAFISGLGLR